MINLQFCSIPVNYNETKLFNIIIYLVQCTALYKLPCTFAPVIYHGIHFQSMITNHLYIFKIIIANLIYLFRIGVCEFWQTPQFEI